MSGDSKNLENKYAEAEKLAEVTSHQIENISANQVIITNSVRNAREALSAQENGDRLTPYEDRLTSGASIENKENSESVPVEKRIDELKNKLPLSYIHYEGTNKKGDALNRERKMTSENGVIKTESVLLVGEDKTPEPGSQTIYELFKIQGGSYMLHQKGKTKDGTLIDKTEQKTSEDVQENVLPVFYKRVDIINGWQEEDNEKNQQIINQQKAQQKADDQLFGYNPDQDQGTLFG